jgi:hypothetical protein
MHWGNIGSFLAGLSTVIIAFAALFRSPGALRDWRARQRAEEDAARARAGADQEQAEEMRLERRRTLLGWSPGGVLTFTTAVVTDPAELEQAARELATHKPGTDGPTSRYVVLRVDEGGDDTGRGRDLRALIQEQGFVCRLPTLAEREALEKGFEVLGTKPAMHWA